MSEIKLKLLGCWENNEIEFIGDYFQPKKKPYDLKYISSPEYHKMENESRKRQLEDFIAEFKHDLEWCFGFYGHKDYSGEAFVLFKKDGKIFENGGSHCSCYGLEGQWNPQETSIEAIKLMLSKGTFGKDRDGVNEFYNELVEFLNEVK